MRGADCFAARDTVAGAAAGEAIGCMARVTEAAFAVTAPAGDALDVPRAAAMRMNSAVSQAEGLLADVDERVGSVTGLGAICAATCMAEGCSDLGDVAKRAPTGRGVHAGSKASAAAFGSGVAEEAAGADAKCEPAFTMRTRDCPAT